MEGFVLLMIAGHIAGLPNWLSVKKEAPQRLVHSQTAGQLILPFAY
jgi:hypothetical protein